jgi:hypothetical protein
MQHNTPLSLWIQIGNLFFLISGIYSDLLLIRFALVLAYVFLLANALLGSPLWPDLDNQGRIQVDAIFWAILNLYVHMSSLIRLVLDERTVSFQDDAEEALWRMFYRCGGLSKRIYQAKVLSHMEIVHM